MPAKTTATISDNTAKKSTRSRRRSPESQVHFVDANGVAVGRLPAGIGDSPDDIEIAREDLSRILADALPEVVGLRLGEPVNSIAERDDRVDVGFASGASESFDLVLGTDGMHPAVRRLVFGPERDWIRHLGLYVAIADMPGETSLATIAYGPEPSQVGELYLPDGDGRFPVVAVFHGGYWSAMWDRRQVTDVVDDLVGRGYAVWNVEYRRVGEPGGGWPGTFLDVAAAVDALDGMDPALDTGRVVLLGHSAGGHLATWAAHRGVLPPEAPGAHPKITPVGVVELAGALDLRAADAAGFGKVLADPEAEPPKDAPEPARPDVWPAVADAVVHPDHPVWPELTGWLHRIVTGQEG